MRTAMRIAVVLLTLVPPATPALAQREAIDRGSLLLGGSVSVGGRHEHGSDATRFYVQLAPNVNVFITRGLAVGGLLLLGYVKEGSADSQQLSVGPQVGYYFGGVSERLYPFVSLAAVFSWISTNSRSSLAGVEQQFHSDLRDVAVRVSAGGVFMLVPHVGISGEAYFERRDEDLDQRGDRIPPILRDILASNYGLAFGVKAFVF